MRTAPLKRWAVGALVVLAACEGRPDLEHSKLLADAKALRPGFLLGTSTSAYQTEGGLHNDWTQWETGTYADGTPHIAGNQRSGCATDSWNKFDEDLGLMKQLGVNAYRFSIEWSRLQPNGRDDWDAQAADRYLGWMKKLRAAGIEPMVTLLHFTLPTWVAAQGGFESKQTVDDFEAFTRRAARAFGAQVDVWVTLNEPNVFILDAYSVGDYPPGKTNSGLGPQILVAELTAHARAARALREEDVWDADGDGRATSIGLAHHVRLFQPASSSALDTSVAGLTDDYFNESIPRALATGHVKLFNPGDTDLDVVVADLKGSVDWLGINYYTRSFLRADLASADLSRLSVPAGRPTSDVGWDIYPDGLYLFLKRFGSLGMPLYVTENGIADATDNLRVDFLRRHLLAVTLAAQEGVDVRGYFHWSLLDNFEWESGFTPRFGLFSVDYSGAPGVDGCPELKRSPTKAVAVFADFAKALAR